MSEYSGIINSIFRTRESGNHGIPFNFDPKLNTYLTGITRGKFYGIGGRSSSGKRSFTDLHFVLNIFDWWAKLPQSNRPKVKILYFNMDKSRETKLLKWLCTYMHIYHNKLIDIPTLMNWPGKLYDLDQETLSQIAAAQGYFDMMFDSGFLTMYDGRVNPTGIRANVAEYFKEIGGTYHDNHTTHFEYEEEYKDQITLIVIDNARKLKIESQQGQRFNERELNKRLSDYCVEMKEMYKATPILIIPSEDVGGHDSKAPSFKEFGVYYNDLDVALHLINPTRYYNKSGYYGNYELNDFQDVTGIQRFRACSIMRNAEGRDSTWIPISFFPETGHILPTPDAEDPGYTDHINYLKHIKSYLNGESNTSE